MSKRDVKSARDEFEETLAQAGATETQAPEPQVVETKVVEAVAVKQPEAVQEPPAVAAEGPNYGPLREIKHITRYLSEMGYPWEQAGPVSADEADRAVGDMMANGWQPIYMQVLGLQPEGIAFLWVMGLPTKTPSTAYTEIKHITRTVGSFSGKAVTGFMADAYLGSYFAEGWTLKYVGTVGMGPEGIHLVWVLVR